MKIEHQVVLAVIVGTLIRPTWKHVVRPITDWFAYLILGWLFDRGRNSNSAYSFVRRVNHGEQPDRYTVTELGKRIREIQHHLMAPTEKEPWSRLPFHRLEKIEKRLDAIEAARGQTDQGSGE